MVAKNNLHTYTYYSRFISEGVAEASQIFLRDAHGLPNQSLPKLLSYEEILQT
jgi:hypothetical protein